MDIKGFWQSRIKSVQFYIRIILISFLPVLGYFGLTGESLTSWVQVADVLYKFIQNPYLVATYLVTLYQSFVSTKK